eukprot:156346-Chlamydomonas_euryale.AAC.3
MPPSPPLSACRTAVVNLATPNPQPQSRQEFVDFLEEELGLPKEDEKKASSSSSSSNSKGKSYGDYTSEDWYKKYEAQAGPDSQPPPRPPPSAQPKKSADDDINDMLAALKKKHGRA